MASALALDKLREARPLKPCKHRSLAAAYDKDAGASILFDREANSFETLGELARITVSAQCAPPFR
jgi:hypothetical protein